MDARKTLQFESFMSIPDISFWQTFAKLKINEIGLSDAPLDIRGTITLQRSSKIRAIARVSEGSFSEEREASTKETVSPLTRTERIVRGRMKNVNTVEDFKTFDKVGFMNEAGKTIWENMISGEACRDPSLLTRFILVTFADLKRHTFLYWFGFPSIAPKGKSTFQQVGPPRSFDDLCTDVSERTDIAIRIEKMGLPTCFVLRRRNGTDIGSDSGYDVLSMNALDSVLGPESKDGGTGEKHTDDIIIGCIDASANPSHPGWTVRNLLVLLSLRWHVKKVTVLCFRDLPSSAMNEKGRSIVFRVCIPDALTAKIDEETPPELSTSCRVVGWERNSKGRFGPRKIELRSQMAPEELAGTAVDLNLKLMRWRMAPSLRPDVLASTRCLLIGAGTLGCHTARLLQGWGVRHITFVDNGRVSYSNPVRQPLFDFTDCSGGGKPKAEAAAAALRRIFPGVRSSGESLHIPMPGHPVAKSAEEACEKTVSKLDRLVRENDVVFLLTDTRESRWLPTLLGTVHRKLVISVALGFDTFVVMRHGHVDQPPSDRLGCYFCNDVVAPTDSTHNRPLDQQCTVTRPGLAALASANAVELLVNLLHHPKRALAPADQSKDLSADCASPFGLIPHQIRGFVSHFQQILPVAKHFPRCTACSSVVTSTYVKEGFGFLTKVFNDPAYAENLTGLSELQKSIVGIDVDWASDDSSEGIL